MEKINYEKITKAEIFLFILFFIQLYYFNLCVQSVSVFSFRIVTATSNLVPYISLSYAIMLFLFFVNFGKLFMALNKDSETEKMEIFNSSLTSLFVIFFLNILAELLTSRIQF